MTQQFEKNGISSKRFDKIEKFYEDVKEIRNNLMIYPGENQHVVSIEVASKVKQKRLATESKKINSYAEELVG